MDFKRLAWFDMVRQVMIVLITAMILLSLVGCQKTAVLPESRIQDSSMQQKVIEQQAIEPQITDEYLKYENEDVSIDYPANWTKKEGVLGTIVIFQSKEGTFSVGVKDVGSENITLDDYSAWNIDQKNKTVEGFKRVEFTNSTISNNLAHVLVFTGNTKSRDKDITFKRVQMWTIEDGKAYMLEYIISVNIDGKEIEYNLSKLKKMASTFQIKDKS